MCTKYRTKDEEIRAGMELDLLTHDGISLRGKWAGSATYERLQDLWLARRGNELVQIPQDVTEVSEEDKDTGEIVWTRAADGTRLFFVLEAAPAGKDYRLAKLVTIEATPEERAYFNQKRGSVPLTGRLEDGKLVHVPLPPVPPPRPKTYLDLF